MAPHKPPRHFLRQWRQHRELSLEQVAERVMVLGAARRDADRDSLSSPVTMTHASLSRIERGLQPYNQVLLELLAEVYMTDVASLLMRNPTDPEGIWSLWDRLPAPQRAAAMAMLQGLARTA